MLATVGTFDGVHRGHRYLLDRLRIEANRRGLKPLAVTFDRHPLAIVAPQMAPPALMSSDERDEVIRAEGVEVARIPFTAEVKSLTGAEFVEMLKLNHGVKALMMGFNNHLGSDRATAPKVPGVELIGCTELPAHSRVSSSAIRELIATGRIPEANEMLGRPFALTGTVVNGKHLGRTLGFPTANVDIPAGLMIPAAGVYAARVLDRDAVVNVGHRPTVDRPDAPISIEAHIIGLSADLYSQPLRIEFLRKLRDERRFASVDELKAAIAADIKNATNHGS